MREIKFRAWDGEKMLFPQTGANNAEFFMGQNSDGLEYSEYLGKGSYKKHPLMQYTGLKDKNGKEIYEGDIVKDDVGDILEVKFGELPLDKSGDCVCTYQAFYCKPYGQLGKAPMYQCENIGEWMEVIDNIYENPDLLTPNTQ